jgi:hypothetical protein
MKKFLRMAFCPFGILLCVSVLNGAIISNEVKWVADNEARHHSAKWTGLTFKVIVAGEPVLGRWSGITVPTFAPGVNAATP